jgi:hypothetical protein
MNGQEPQAPPPPPAPLPAPTLTPNETFEMRVRAAERAHDDEKEFGVADGGEEC